MLALAGEKTMVSRIISVALMLVIPISGCSGGSSPSNCLTAPLPTDCQIVVSPPPPPSNNENPEGLWLGHYSDDTDPSVSNVLLGTISQSKEFRFFSRITGAHFVGQMPIDGTQFTGTGDAWTATGTTWSDGSVLTSITINGEVLGQQSLNGAWSTTSSDSGTISLSYDPTNVPSLAAMEANWFYTDGNYSITISMDEHGRFAGSDTEECLYDGGITAPGLVTNFFFSSHIQLSNCGIRDDKYYGSAIVVNDDMPADTLIISTNNSLSVNENNGHLAMLIELARQ
jgi:hypothetical protein